MHHNFIVANYAADGGCLDNDDGSSYYSIRSNFCVYGGHKQNFDGHDKHAAHNLYVYPQVQALFAHVDPRTRDQSVVEGIFRELQRRLRQLATEAERYSRGPLGDAVFDAQSFSIVDCCLPGTLLLAERLATLLLAPPPRPSPPPLLGRGRLRRWLGAELH